MSKLWLFVLLWITAVIPVRAAEPPAELWLKKPTLQQLQKIYDHYGYAGERGYLLVPSYHYPPIFLNALPSDYDRITSEQERAIKFNQIMAPLALRAIADIMAERRKIEELDKIFRERHELSPAQTEFLENKAKKYDIFTHLQGTRRTAYLLSELLVRADGFPPSFLIGVAALETNWGSSRLAAEGNALYKERVWHTKEGLKPQEAEAGEDYRYKTYPTLYQSVSDFALKLNSHVNFAEMRRFRKELRRRGQPLLGTTFAYSLLWNSPLSNYAGILEYTIAFYELNIIDKSVLDSKIIAKPLPEELRALQTRPPESK